MDLDGPSGVKSLESSLSRFTYSEICKKYYYCKFVPGIKIDEYMRPLLNTIFTHVNRHKNCSKQNNILSYYARSKYGVESLNCRCEIIAVENLAIQTLMQLKFGNLNIGFSVCPKPQICKIIVEITNAKIIFTF